MSNVSNGALAHSAEVIDVLNGMVRGVLVDVVDGDLEVLYRRYSVDWIKLVPLDAGPAPHGGLPDLDVDLANLDACARYTISVEPIA
jgi:hypothetical protein